jgi:beta-mannanase
MILNSVNIMKKVLFIVFIASITFACKTENKTEEISQESQEMAFASFGDKIEAEGAISASAMSERFNSLNAGDTLTTKVSAKINEVCSKKGCWMKLDLGNEQEVMVTFKDYGFFMPLNAEGDVIINGKAFVTETSVDELRHYAEDAGKTTEEIEAITEVEKTFAFEADGVLLKQ